MKVTVTSAAIWGTYGGNFDGSRQIIQKPEGAPEGAYFHPKMYMRSVVELFDRIRTDIGWELEIMHDVHERLPLADTLAFAKELEPFKLFFPGGLPAPGSGLLF